jgi:hypothetical protein
MKRLLTIASLVALAATTAGCSSTSSWMPRCSCFGNRGAQCDACTVPAANYCCPQTNCCDPCAAGGYYGGGDYYNPGYSAVAPTLQGGGCCGGAGGMVQDGGMIYGGGVQVVPAPSTGTMIMPTQPVPGPETSLQP